MDIIVAKVLSGLLFFVLALCFGWLPFCLYQRFSSSRGTTGHVKDSGHGLMHCMHSLASGVLIATCLLHLLPESLEAVEKGLKSRYYDKLSPHQITLAGDFVFDSNASLTLEPTPGDKGRDEEDRDLYPVAELLVALGFIFVYIFDSTIKAVKGRGGVGGAKGDYKTLSLRSKGSSGDQSDSSSDMDLELDRYHSASATAAEGEDLMDRRASPGKKKKASSTQSVGTADVRSAALVMALCVHGFFDGVVLGLQTSVPVIESLLFALSLHKTFVSLSLSLTLAKNDVTSNPHEAARVRSRSRYFLYVVAFSSVAPLGLVASAAFVHSRFVTSPDDDVSLVPGCLQAFAVGTFLYVTFTETTGHHGGSGTVWAEIRGHVFLVMGFALMASLRLAFGST